METKPVVIFLGNTIPMVGLCGFTQTLVPTDADLIVEFKLYYINGLKIVIRSDASTLEKQDEAGDFEFTEDYVNFRDTIHAAITETINHPNWMASTATPNYQPVSSPPPTVGVTPINAIRAHLDFVDRSKKLG
jgi:hypothetical protein